jgi:hypothetical protein
LRRSEFSKRAPGAAVRALLEGSWWPTTHGTRRAIQAGNSRGGFSFLDETERGEVMQTGTVIAIVVALVLLVVIAWLMLDRKKSGQLRSRFGPEYDRALEAHPTRREAEADLADRQKRVEHLTIRPLDPNERQRFSDLWRRQQERFVDDPQAAVGEADALVSEVMRTRGYPMAEFDQRAADISVDHPAVVEHYRAGHDIAARQRAGSANTEDLRSAMLHFRALFEELLQGGPGMAPAARY